jgi:segregation and condensation protein B
VTESENLAAVVEALLFVSDEPVSAARLARVADASPGDVEAALADLSEQYKENERGFQL